MRLHLGTSGFSYPAWRGRFYPKAIKPADMLAFYASRLNAVEINNTFYRMPTKALLAGWAAAVPDGFELALKVPERVTTSPSIQAVAVVFQRFVETAKTLEVRLGPLMFRLPE